MLPSFVTHHHVHAHQDRTTAWVDLDIPGKLNVTADSLATKALDIPSQIKTPAFIPSSHVQFILEDQAILTDPAKAIQYAAALPNLCTYWAEKLCMSAEQSQDIDFHLLTKIHSGQTYQQRFLVRFILDKLPMQHTMNQCKPHYSPNCHYCSQIETQIHVISCQHHHEYMTNQQTELKEMLLSFCLSQEHFNWFQSFFQQWTHPWLFVSDGQFLPFAPVIGLYLKTFVHKLTSYFKQNQPPQTATQLLKKYTHFFWNTFHKVWKLWCADFASNATGPSAHNTRHVQAVQSQLTTLCQKTNSTLKSQDQLAQH